MAIKEAKTNTDLDALFTQLAEPFDPNQIKWRVTHTTQDGSRGAVVAYADPRGYTDRLNQLFTPTGWTRTYEVSTVSAVTRMKKDKLIQTGKVRRTDQEATDRETHCGLTITLGVGYVARCFRIQIATLEFENRNRQRHLVPITNAVRREKTARVPFPPGPIFETAETCCFP